MARPTKLTPERQDRITRAIREGAYAEVATRAAGVAPSTYYDWLRRGREGEEPYSVFLEAVEQADAEAEVAAVGVINAAAASGDWRAAKALLERRFNRRWGARATVSFGESGEAAPDNRELARE